MSDEWKAVPGGNPRATASWPAALGGCLFGLGIAAAILPTFPLTAASDQIPGFARDAGFSPTREVLRFALFVALAVAGAVAAVGVREILRRTGARIATATATPAPWLALSLCPAAALAGSGLVWSLATSVLAFAGVAVWKHAWGTPRRLSLLLATLSAQTLVAWSFFGGTSLAPRIPMVPQLAFLFFLFAAIARAAGRNVRAAVLPFAPTVALVPIALWRLRPASVDAAAFLACLVLPALVARSPRRPAVDRALRSLLPATLAGSFLVLAAAAMLRSRIAGVFEDGHALLPASEYLAGRLPYRDIVPAHGLFTDGLIQAAEMKLFGVDYDGLARGERLVGVLFWPIVLALGAAATGRVETGFWGAALTFLVFPQIGFTRAMASLVMLAACARVRRRTSRRGWIVVGALLPFTLLWAVDFAVYAGAALAAALWVSRGKRPRNAVSVAAGATISSVAILATLSLFGIAGSFVRTTFLLLPRLGPAYALGFPPLPESMTPALLPDSLGTVTDPHGLYFWYVLLAVIALALLASRRRTAGERERALLPFVVWFLAATLSVIERRHFAYAFLAVGTAIALAGRALWDPRRGGALRIAAVLLIAWAIVVPRPLGLAGAFEGAFRHREAAAEGYVYPQGPGRWKGAGFRPGEVAAIRAARVFVGANLAPGETWLDFASVPSLYWFLDRRCPIRWYEVSFYENPPEQGEVVRALATDRRIRAVLVHFPALGDPIDGIPNAARAPQVWESIRRDFHPAFSEAGVEFWLRRSDR